MKIIWTLSVSIYLFAYVMIVAPVNNISSNTNGTEVGEIVKANEKVKKILKKDISKYVYIKQRRFEVDRYIAL